MYIDITDTSGHAKAVEYVRSIVQADGLNVLYNNAGTGGKSVRLAATRETDILSSFKLNACAHVLMTQVKHYSNNYSYKHFFLNVVFIAAVISTTLESGSRGQRQRTGGATAIGGY